MVVVTVIIACLSYGVLTLPKVQPATADGFSAERVINDLKVIAEKPHSVIHEENRKDVRYYLAGRLEGLGAQVEFFEYDSTFMIGKGIQTEYLFDCVNILGTIEPAKALEDTTYLMLIAHYDSRPPRMFGRDTVCSMGAADDAYGVGVILETVNQAMKCHQDWYQGVKVLFTDGEEVGLGGISESFKKDRHIFDNVGFVINIEARGPYAPCLLFETSANNAKVVDFYTEQASYPTTYSLTTVVYSFLPNYTDFKIIKDSTDIPGMNFSTINDVNHYHTHLDNLGNVSAKAVQHYGAQICPVALKYLTGKEYASKEAFKASEDKIFFTHPAVGMIKFTKKGYMITNIVTLVLFLLAFVCCALRGRMSAGSAFKQMGLVLILGLAMLGVGEFIAWAAAAAYGTKFSMFGVVDAIMQDNLIMILSVVLMAALVSFFYLRSKDRHVRKVSSSSIRRGAAAVAGEKFSVSRLYGALLLHAVLTAVLLFALGENLMFFIPLFCGLCGVLLWRLTGIKEGLLIAFAAILLHALSFLTNLALALTIGAFGAIALLAFFDLMVLIPMADLYLSDKKSLS